MDSMDGSDVESDGMAVVKGRLLWFSLQVLFMLFRSTAPPFRLGAGK